MVVADTPTPTPTVDASKAAPAEAKAEDKADKEKKKPVRSNVSWPLALFFSFQMHSRCSPRVCLGCRRSRSRGAAVAEKRRAPAPTTPLLPLAAPVAPPRMQSRLMAPLLALRPLPRR